MEPYTKLTESAIRHIAEQYPLPFITDFKPLSGGLENSNYLLQTKTAQYVLTICERKTREESEALAKLLLHLEQHGFITTQIIPTKDGNSLGNFQKKPIFIKSFLEGEIRENLSDTLIFQLGKLIGQLHQVPPPPFMPTFFSYGQQFFPEITEEKIEHPFAKWLSQKHDYIKEHLHPELPKRLIHGDVFDNNVIISSKETPFIIDFEEACHYYRIYDLGMAMVGLCKANGKIIPSKIQELLRGYQHIQNFTDLERLHLQAFAVYAATATAFWRFRQFNFVVPDPALKDHYLEMQGLADQLMMLDFEDLID